MGGGGKRKVDRQKRVKDEIKREKDKGLQKRIEKQRRKRQGGLRKEEIVGIYSEEKRERHGDYEKREKNGGGNTKRKDR